MIWYWVNYAEAPKHLMNASQQTKLNNESKAILSARLENRFRRTEIRALPNFDECVPSMTKEISSSYSFMEGKNFQTTFERRSVSVFDRIAFDTANAY